MSRLQQNRTIDGAINFVTPTESQCSLSGADLDVLNKALTRLQALRRKKGKTNEQIRQEIAEVVLTLINLFRN